jgi:DNA-binding NarL/FixJ family response regulator
MLEDDAALNAAIRAGASGYFLKDTEQDALLRAISAVAAGDVVFGAAVAGKVLAHLAAGERPAALAFPQLTRREVEVLDLVARGDANAAIARRLQLTDKTVRNHVSNILVKLQAAGRAEAIVLAREAGLGRRPGHPGEPPG